MNAPVLSETTNMADYLLETRMRTKTREINRRDGREEVEMVERSYRLCVSC